MANWTAEIYNTLKEAEAAIEAIADSREIHTTAFKEGAFQKVLVAQGSPYPSVTDIWDKNISAYTGAKAGTYLKTLYDDWLNGGRLDLILDAIAAEVNADALAQGAGSVVSNVGVDSLTRAIADIVRAGGSGDLAAMDDIVDNILLDTQLKFTVSGSHTFTTGLENFLNIDSGTDGAEIVSITVKGIVSGNWTIKGYIPTDDAVASPAAGDKRFEESYASADTEGGQLANIGAIRYNLLLDITNDSAGDDDIDEVIIAYRSRGTVTAVWEGA